MPALRDFPRTLWRRLLDQAWALLTPAQLNYVDPAGEPALRLRDARCDDVEISAQLLAQGIVAPALSQHAVGQRAQSWRGLLLGYAQVPVEQMGERVARLARVIRAF